MNNNVKEGTPANVDAYIAAQPAEVQPRLQEVRAIIKNAAPKAEEVISYQMAGYKSDGMLIWFGAQKKHCGLYMPGFKDVQMAFAAALAPYKMAKGTLQLPYDQPLPVDLITRIVLFRAERNKEAKMKKAGAKMKK